MMSRWTPASCGAENRGFSNRPIIARMRKANAFSTPGDVVGGGGGVWVLLKKEAMVLVLVLQAVLSSSGCQPICLAQRLVLFQSSRSSRNPESASRAAALTLLCSSALQQAVSALHALLADQALWQA